MSAAPAPARSAVFDGDLPRPWRVARWEPGHRIEIGKGWALRPLAMAILFFLPFSAPAAVLLAPERARPYLGGEDPMFAAAGLALVAVFPGALGAAWLWQARPRRTAVDWTAGAAGAATDGGRTLALPEVEAVELRYVVVGVRDRVVDAYAAGPAQRSYEVRLVPRGGGRPVVLVDLAVSVFEEERDHPRVQALAEALAAGLGVPFRPPAGHVPWSPSGPR
jgi:hypothetical protein